MHLTRNEEDFLQTLLELGIKRCVATMLVYLAHSHVATTRALRSCTDLDQNEISTAIRYLLKQGWVESCESRTMVRGRPVRIYKLAKPVAVIMDNIGQAKTKEMENQLRLLRKLREHVS